MKKEHFKKLILVLLFVYCIGLLVKISIHRTNYQWDFRTYYYAARAHSLGLNPYDNRELSRIAGRHVSSHYCYPPVTLFFFRLFSLADYNTAFYLYLGFKCILLIGLIYLWRKEFLQGEVDAFFYPFCLLAFNSTIYIDMICGNIRIPEQFLIWLAFYFYLKRKLLLFCVFILLAAVFQVTPVLFLFLLWFSEDRKKHIYLFLSSAVFLTFLLVSRLATPHLFAGFMSNVAERFTIPIFSKGMFNPSTYALTRDLFASLKNETEVAVPYAIQLTLYFAVVTAIIFVSQRAYIALRSFKVKDKGRIAVFLACLVYALILPRFKDYSYILLIVPTYFIIKKADFAKGYVLLLILVLFPPPHNYMLLPGVRTISGILREYYPLIIVYCAWGLYLYTLFNLTKRPVATTFPNSA